jgi:hypothetical protein
VIGQSPRARLLRSLSIALAALPLAFGLVRAVSTGNDLRYVWVALASLLGAAAIMAVARTSRGGPLVAVAMSAAVFVTSTCLAMLAALLLGTRMGAGMLVVASSCGLCCAASCLLYKLAGSRGA